MDHPIAVESFSVPQAAAALGRSVITIRRWIESDKIPAPYLEDVQRHYLVYSVGELEVLARIIAQHEREFTYLASEHNDISLRIHQAIFGYRAQFV